MALTQTTIDRWNALIATGETLEQPEVFLLQLNDFLFAVHGETTTKQEAAAIFEELLKQTTLTQTQIENISLFLDVIYKPSLSHRHFAATKFKNFDLFRSAILSKKSTSVIDTTKQTMATIAHPKEFKDFDTLFSNTKLMNQLLKLAEESFYASNPKNKDIRIAINFVFSFVFFYQREHIKIKEELEGLVKEYDKKIKEKDQEERKVGDLKKNIVALKLKIDEVETQIKEADPNLEKEKIEELYQQKEKLNQNRNAIIKFVDELSAPLRKLEPELAKIKQRIAILKGHGIDMVICDEASFYANQVCSFTTNSTSIQKDIDDAKKTPGLDIKNKFHAKINIYNQIYSDVTNEITKFKKENGNLNTDILSDTIIDDLANALALAWLYNREKKDFINKAVEIFTKVRTKLDTATEQNPNLTPQQKEQILTSRADFFTKFIETPHAEFIEKLQSVKEPPIKLTKKLEPGKESHPELINTLERVYKKNIFLNVNVPQDVTDAWEELCQSIRNVFENPEQCCFSRINFQEKTQQFLGIIKDDDYRERREVILSNFIATSSLDKEIIDNAYDIEKDLNAIDVKDNELLQVRISNMITSLNLSCFAEEKDNSQESENKKITTEVLLRSTEVIDRYEQEYLKVSIEKEKFKEKGINISTYAKQFALTVAENIKDSENHSENQTENIYYPLILTRLLSFSYAELLKEFEDKDLVDENLAKEKLNQLLPEKKEIADKLAKFMRFSLDTLNKDNPNKLSIKTPIFSEFSNRLILSVVLNRSTEEILTYVKSCIEQDISSINRADQAQASPSKKVFDEKFDLIAEEFKYVYSKIQNISLTREVTQSLGELSDMLDAFNLDLENEIETGKQQTDNVVVDQSQSTSKSVTPEITSPDLTQDIPDDDYKELFFTLIHSNSASINIKVDQRQMESAFKLLLSEIKDLKNNPNLNDKETVISLFISNSAQKLVELEDKMTKNSPSTSSPKAMQTPKGFGLFDTFRKKASQNFPKTAPQQEKATNKDSLLLEEFKDYIKTDASKQAPSISTPGSTKS